MRSVKFRNMGWTLLLAGVVCPGAVRAQGRGGEREKDAQLRAEWMTRLNKIAPDDWRSARGEVGALAGLAPGKAIAMLRALWPTLTSGAVKREITFAFVNAEHPDTLRVLELAAGDGDAKSQDDVLFGIDQALLLPQNTKPPEAFAILRRMAVKPLASARRERMREIARAIRVGDAPALEALTRPLSLASRSAELRALAAKNGVLEACAYRLIAPDTTPQQQATLLEMLNGFDLPPATLAKIILPLAVNGQDKQSQHNPSQDSPSDYNALQYKAFSLLARAGYAPGYAPLLRALAASVQNENPATFLLAQAVAEYGRPDAIPTLISLISSDNTYNTTYNIGYVSLGWLTGAMYDPHHDGNWWRLWWERNHDNLPETVRNLPISEFPHTRSWQEPLPREIHLDPQKYRRQCLQELTRALQQANGQETGPSSSAMSIARMDDPTMIPDLIGLIASDNTLAATYGIGYFALGTLTGVSYDGAHDGNWWRLWWEQHRKELPANTRDLPIPEYPHTPAYREPIPIPLHQNRAELRAYLLTDLKQQIARGNNTIYSLVKSIADLKDPAAIAPLVEMLPAEKQSSAFHLITEYALPPLAGVPYAESRDRAWWQQWWREHQGEVEKRVAAFVPSPPDYLRYAYKPQRNLMDSPFVTAYEYAPRVKPKPLPGETVKPEPDPEDIRDVSSQRIVLRGDAHRVYRLVGFSPTQPVPSGGYKLLVVLPGGDGSDEFRWFVRRLKKFALPADTLIAQIIAPKWNEHQAQELVWPTRANGYYGMKFPTEQLIEEVIRDAGRRTQIAPEHVYALAWSSSGPAVYTALATPRSSLRGAFMAMSVFRPGELPEPKTLNGKRVFLYHSPQDFIAIRQAHEAEQFLREHGAQTQFREYPGGHGWNGDTYQDVRGGLDWLIKTQ